MMRGTFANIRIKHQMTPGIEGGVTKHIPTGEVMPLYDAAMRYKEAGTPLVVLAGTDYGTCSSRGLAATGQNLVGVRAGLAETSVSNPHSHQVGPGVVPPQLPGTDHHA